MNKTRIKHSSPYIDEKAERYILKVLRSGNISTGETVREFEKKLSEFVNVKHCVCVSSGTSALYLILRYLKEISGKDQVIIPSFTCPAILNAVKFAGAVPVFSDIQRDTMCLSVEDVKKKINDRTIAIVFVHSFGYPADLGEFLKTDIKIIEAIAQSIGAKTGDKGYASFSSFYATKIITTGEGGAVFSNDAELVNQVRDFINYDKKEYAENIRFNFKMSDIQAALGISQLENIEFILGARKKIAKIYYEELSDIKVKLPPKTGIFYRFVVDVGKNSDDIIQKAREKGIEVDKPIYKPLHLFYGQAGQLPVTEQVYRNSISLPIHPRMTTEDAKAVAYEIRRLLSSC